MSKRSDDNAIRQGGRAPRGGSTRLGLSVAAACLLLIIAQNCGFGQPATGPPSLIDNMDRPQPTMRLSNAGPSTQLLRHFADMQQRRFGSSAEHAVYRAPPGESARFAIPIPPALVIEECKILCWAKCSRSGLALEASVVLPRSIDPRTGQPRRLFVRGRSDVDEGDWRQLRLDQLESAVAAQARVARAGVANGSTIDEREAYIDQIVLLAPGGPGPAELLVDQISIYGVLGSRTASPPSSAASNRLNANNREPSATAPKRNQSRPNPDLLNPPGFARAIQWQGEPLAHLQQLGFDALWMGRPPQQAELDEAERLGLLLICPPESDFVGSQPTEPALESHSAVLAWDLGQPLSEVDLHEASERRRRIDRRDRLDRPTLIRPGRLVREASRVADALILGEALAGTSLGTAAYAQQLVLLQRLARPGAGIWITAQTHLGVRRQAQISAVRASRAALVPVTYDDVTRQINASLGVRPRGVLFQSHASLASGGVENLLRAKAIELSNLRLGLLEPWLASGSPITAAACSSPNVTGLAFKAERSHLIVPMFWDASADPDAGLADSNDVIAFTMPGIPETSQAYLITPAGTERLRSRRVAGGLQIAVEGLPRDAVILATEDGRAFTQIVQYVRQHAQRANKLRLEMLQLQLQLATRALKAAPSAIQQSPDVTAALSRCEQFAREATALGARQDWSAAYSQAAAGEAWLNALAAQLHARVNPSSRPGDVAVNVGWLTLPDAVRVATAVATATQRAELVNGGEFEELSQVLQAGWRRLQPPAPGVTAAVRLSPEAPASGRYSLELEAQPTDPEGAPPTTPAPPVWIRSPEIAIESGSLIEITGRVRTPEPLVGAADALLIYDSLGGREMALRVRNANQWEPFRLVRAAPANGITHLTIALHGVGRVQIDSIHMRILPLAGEAKPMDLENAQARRRLAAPWR